MSSVSTIHDHLSWRTVDIPGPASTSHLQVYIGEVGAEGRKALLTAGVHGDEGPWGALALRQVLDISFTNLKGRLRVVYAANPSAIQADHRNAPLDVLDLNRNFPGDSNGSHTEALAAALAPLAHEADVVIDLHGGGSWCVNAFVFRFAGSEALAEAVGAPFIMDAPDKTGTLTQYAHAHGARVVAIEMGGRSRAELMWRDRLAAGVSRVLEQEGLIAGETPTANPGQPVGASSVLRSPVGGMFTPTLREDKVGTVLPQGTELGKVFDLNTLELRHVFTAPYPQTAILLLRPHICVLEGGAMTYVVAEPALGR